MLAWMGYAVLTATAFGATAWLLDFAVAGRFARRRVLWAGVFVASAIGPIVFSATRGGATDVAAGRNEVTAAARWGNRPIVPDRLLGWIWLGTSAASAFWLLATQHRLRRQMGACAWEIVDGERVLVSAHFGPAVVGVVRPTIVLPEWALTISDSERKIIVAHETEHRKARDPLLLAAALAMVAALPWNVALWWQLRRLRLTIEIDCDRRVVSNHGHDAHTYGLLLVATRERASRATPALATAMAAMRSGLGRRVEALVGGRPRSAIGRLSALAAAVVVVAAIITMPAPRLPIAQAAVAGAPAALPPGVGAPTVVVRGSSVRVILPPSARDGAAERGGRGRPASSTEERWISMPGNRRVVQSKTAPNRWMLLPDSLSPSRR